MKRAESVVVVPGRETTTGPGESPRLVLAVPVADPSATPAAERVRRREKRRARIESLAGGVIPPTNAARTGRSKRGSKTAKTKAVGKQAAGRPKMRKAGLGAGVVVAVAATAGAVRSLPVRKVALRAGRTLGARLRYLQGKLKGLWYRGIGRGPAPAMTDRVLADRIRSSLGPLERRLGVPRVNVMVEDGVAILHGEVGTEDNARQIAEAVSEVAGVIDVRSNLNHASATSDAE